MSAETTAVADERTARTNLINLKDALALAVDRNNDATEALRNRIVQVRPQGLLTVDEMGEAVGKDRNYIDSVWSTHGETVKGKQTRVPVPETADAEAARSVYEELKRLSEDQVRAQSNESTARTARDRAVTLVYKSRTLGPSAIAAAVDVDRNHVLRIARANGVGPVHRPGTRNQHSTR